MYLIIHPCFCICFINDKYFPEDDHERLKYVIVLIECVKKHNFNNSAFVSFII